MALSGSFYEYATSKFGLYCEWRGTQNIIGNYTDVTLDKYLSYSQLEVGSRTDSVISINNVSETYTTAAINDYSSGYKKKKLKSKTVRIYHNAQGKAENIPLSASWRFSGTYGGVSVGTINASDEITLDQIDRTTPTVSLSITEATASTISFCVVSSAECDSWQYRINGNTWVQFFAENTTSTNYTLSELENNSDYTIEVRAYKTSNGIPGTAVVSVKTIGCVTLNSVSRLDADSPAPEFEINYTVYSGEYSHEISICKDLTQLYSYSLPTRAPGTYQATIPVPTENAALILAEFPDSKYARFKFTLTASEGSEIFGSSSKEAYIYTSEAYSTPIFDGFTCRDNNQATVAITGNDQYFIRNHSSPRIEMGTYSAKNGAVISKIEVLYGTNQTALVPAQSFEILPFEQAGEIEVTATVVDSRGYASSHSTVAHICDYEAPCPKTHSVKRVDNITDTVHCVVSGKFSPIIINGEAKNTIESIQYVYKIESFSEGEWSESKSLTGFTVNGDEYILNQTLQESFDPQLKSFIQLTVKDKLEEHTNTYIIYRAFPEMSIRKRKIGIDCTNPQRTLDVGGEIGMNGYNVLGFVRSLDINDDLNEINDTGYYHIHGTADIERNYPTSDVDGVLECIMAQDECGVQKIYPYNNTGFYIRSEYNGEWTQWKTKMYT